MNSRIIITLACVALAFAAKAEYQPMASKALLEKRITEVNTNIETKLSKLRNDVFDMIDARFYTETNNASVKAKNADIMMRLYGYALRGEEYYNSICTNIGESVISPTTDRNLVGLYLAWDKQWHDHWTCATNAYAGASSWQKVTFSPGVTNVQSYFISPSGERYNLASPMGYKRTYVSSVDTNRIVTLRYNYFDDASYRIIMGRE